MQSVHHKQFGRQMFAALMGCADNDPEPLVEDLVYITDVGVFRHRIGSEERRRLRRTELNALEAHPTGCLDEPALPFPFDLKDLVEFERACQVVLDRWHNCVGELIPTKKLDGEALELVIALNEALKHSEEAPVAERKVDYESPRVY